MLKIETAPDHVIAVRLTGVVEKSDILGLEKAFEEKLSDGRRLCLLLDIEGFADMTVDAIEEDVKFELGMLAKLSQFDKMAIVSDKQFVEAIVKYLDPLLPSVSIKTFGTDKRTEADAFVAALSSVEPKTGSSVTQIETGNSNLLAFDIAGTLTSGDLEPLVGTMEAAFERKNKIDLLLRISQYRGFDPAILLQKNLWSMKTEALTHVRRYAIVGAKDWMKNLAGAALGMLQIEVRFFDADEEEAAWVWLKG